MISLRPLILLVGSLSCLISPALAGLWDTDKAPLSQASEDAFRLVSTVPPREGLPSSVASDLFGVSIGMKFNDAREALLKRVPGKPPQKTCNPFGGCDAPVLKDAFNLSIYTNYETAATKLYIQDPCPKSGCPTNLRLTTDIAGMEYRSGIRAHGAMPDGSSESFRLLFSTPASGHQLLHLQYIVSYQNDKQPRFEDWIARLREKFGASPILLGPPNLNQSTLVYADGWLRDASSLQKGAINASCGGAFPEGFDPLETKLKSVAGAQCRLVIKMVLFMGASPNHVGKAVIEIWDPRRTALNLAADIQGLYALRATVERKLDTAAPKL